MCRFAWVPQGVAQSDGLTVYEQDPPVFLRDGNTEYYLDDANFENARLKMSWVRRLKPTGQLLDVGANFGHFAAVASEVFDVEGLEPSPVATRWARERLGLELVTGSVHDIRSEFERRFDVVTMWDVLEHLAEPEDALAIARRYLKPDGVLFVSTPDASSLVARVMSRHWHHLDLVQHVALFDRRNLKTLLARQGFRFRAVRSARHRYRMAYIVERTRYLGRSALPWRIVSTALQPLAAIAPEHISVSVGDVMEVAADVRS